MKINEVKDMNKRSDNEETGLEAFLKDALTYNDFKSIHTRLGISKKMCTAILRDPKKLDIIHLMKLSQMTHQPLECITKFILE